MQNYTVLSEIPVLSPDGRKKFIFEAVRNKSSRNLIYVNLFGTFEALYFPIIVLKVYNYY